MLGSSEFATEPCCGVSSESPGSQIRCRTHDRKPDCGGRGVSVCTLWSSPGSTQGRENETSGCRVVLETPVQPEGAWPCSGGSDPCAGPLTSSVSSGK